VSRIHFHSPTDTIDIHGSERYHADSTCRDKMWQAFGGEQAGVELLRPYLPDFWKRVPWEEARYYLIGSGVFGGSKLTDGNKELDISDLSLNTALEVGSDAVRLLARLHGQCELHCWVDGHNRNWLADIIHSGREEGVLREGMGWEELILFLRDCNDEPVVCSYSVSDQFPNFGMLPKSHRLKKREAKGEDIDDLIDAYYRMRWTTQWKYCMQELRQRKGLLEMKPEGWSDYYFGNGITAANLVTALSSTTTDAADTITIV
jgi:hypothetical protein